MSMKDKVIAITGAASDIGLATTRLLVDRDAIVCMADANTTMVETCKAIFAAKDREAQKDRISVTKVDFTNRAEVNCWIKAIVERFERLDGAANIAGIMGNSRGVGAVTTAVEDEEWDRVMNVNLKGCMCSLRAELDSIEKKGSIVNVTAMHDTNNGMVMSAACSASRHGIFSLAKAAAKEHGHREVRVNAVTLGAIHTPSTPQAPFKLGQDSKKTTHDSRDTNRQRQIDKVAGVICDLLGPGSAHITGAVCPVDGDWL
ncbi:hypothetical protein V2A60_009443 [Cordyceps javanica]